MKLKSSLKVFKRELRALFFSPVAYIIMTLFLVTTGWFFFSTYFLAGRADLRDYFSLLPLILTFVIPAMTMRSFAEEYRSGSYEILVTLPVSRLEIVVGKYLSALAMVLIMLAPTVLYAFFVGITGDLDWGPVAGGFIGAVFLASAFTAIGIYASSLTHNQIVAFIIAVAVNFFLVLIDKMLILFPGFLTGFLQYLGADYHFKSVAKGVIDSRDLIYFLTVTYTALHLTYLVHRENKNDWIRFSVYMILAVLINLVSSTLFFRIDMTENKVYSLSEMSRRSVATLEEPLTIRIFLSENLPQPYNNLNQELRDMMEEYALEANRFFNYEIYQLDSQDTSLTSLASKYGIQPVQIQNYDNNEVSLVSVYMGMVVLQGDLSETINTLGFETNLEFQITSVINDLAAKTNALLAMDKDIDVKLVFSSPLMEMGNAYRSYPEEVESLLDGMQGEFFNRLRFEYVDPTVSGVDSVQNYDLNSYNIRTSTGENQRVYAALVIEKGEEFSKIELVEQTIIGDRIKEPQTLEEPLRSVADRLLGVQKVIGYLSDHGAPALFSNPYAPQQQQRALGNFYQLLSQGYELRPVTLDDLPQGLETLIIAGVSQEFSPWELYQLDQFLLQGGALGIFLDPYKEEMPQGQMGYFGGQPTYTPVNTGLEDLLAHHGIRVKQAYLMDKQGYVSRSQSPNGGYQEVELPFAPEIDQANINNDLPFMKNIKGLIMLNTAPLEVSASEGLRATTLFSSSPEAWEMSEDITLVPQMIYPPAAKEMGQYSLSVLVEGEFTSYFKGKDLPEPPKKETQEEDNLLLSQSSVILNPLERGTGGQLFVLGSSMVLGDNILDSQGQTPNSQFILNTVDLLAGNEDLAVMRSKGLTYNPIRSDLTSGAKTVIKTFNIVGIPVLVVLAGILVWLYWLKRKNRIRITFTGGNE